MKYVSTRGGMESASFCDVTIEGLAPDGGLVVPESYPEYTLEDLQRIKGYKYQDLAKEIIGNFADDIPKKDLDDIIIRTYNKKIFGTDGITPLKEIYDDFYIQDLSNGPTLAFKDIALQFLGNSFEYILNERNDYIIIIGASSGDTVIAAEEAVKGKKNVLIVFITPYNKMSPFQTAQAYTIDAKNVRNVAIPGVFDDGQDLIKVVSSDINFKNKYHLGAMNSINWARIAAQVVYYFKGYFSVADKIGEKVDFSVPTGNFGNVLAGHIAREMGLPIRKLIVATNENNVLDIFYKTGIYKSWKTEDVIQTSSPSMDISKASNFERFLWDLFNKDSKTTKDYMDEFAKNGFINLKKTEYFDLVSQEYGFVSDFATEQQRLDTIKKIYKDTNREVIIDPHTANAVKVANVYKEDGVKLICLATAKPTKFEEIIKLALGFVPERPEEFIGIENKKHIYDLMKDKRDVKWFKNYIINFYNEFKSQSKS